MNDKQYTDSFDPEVQCIASEDGCEIYKMKNSTGEGVITQYKFLRGIELFYNDFHMRDGENKLPRPNVLEILLHFPCPIITAYPFWKIPEGRQNFQ